MRREVRRIGRSLSNQVGHSAEDWTDQIGGLSRDAARNAAHFAELAGTQARRSARYVQKDPLPLIAVIGTGLLIAHLLKRQ
jgi:hypothetical protein